ncbi:SusC/RagA family TonB-linked outer membrane protein [Flavobacterium sp. 7A]|uniref:SusC/RagA family TonB-linked outer membrane protein n=1 Tax=Flavobacterium sp. 7A TaxID=2940571 RepID=UPI002225DC89|nr:TonB-dependent receptor [Flavobacterium sp. 7A]MCW2120433.1 TonB-linked SusC/RagA family outer membrane protein [Flavobacterium sp. 7A]
MMIKLKFALIALAMICTQTVLSQTKTIQGVVTDQARLPLPGVNVSVKGIPTGVVTNSDGSFVLDKVPANARIIFSFIGFTSKEVAVDNKKTINVSLVEDTNNLDEVVVVGYGSVKKRDVTGAVSTVSAKMIKDQPFTGVDQALQGKVSGVTVTQNSGTPGGGVSIRIRGIASLSGNEPLYVVDGVPINGGDNNDSFNYNSLGGGSGQTKSSALSAINPSDIESMDILKDASATAIYGSRGSNGVVLITTKKGKKGKSVITYETYTGVQQVTKFLDVLNLQDFAKYRASVSTELGQQIPYEFQNPEILGQGTNWQKEIFKNAQMQNHQITISGGKDNTRYYTSMNYFEQDGIVINTGFKRYSMRLNIDTKVNDWFKIGNNLTLSNTKQKLAFNDTENGVISAAVSQSPNIPVRYSDGSFGGPIEGFGNTSANNPVATALNRGNNVDKYKIVGSLFGEISFTKDLTFKSVLGYDFNTTNGSVFYPDITIGTTSTSSISVKQQNQSIFWTLQNYFTYSKTFGKHNFVALLGQEAQQSNYEGISGTRRGYLSNDISTLNLGDSKTATNDNYKGRSSLNSYFTRLNYSFDGKYLLTATLRSDTSSNFGDGYKTGYFPSFAAGWVISNEPFFEGIKGVINHAKFRAGYGEVGNQNIGSYTYGASIVSFPTSFGTGFAQQNIQNPTVQWEKTKASNFGVEIGFFKDALRLDVDYYKKVSSDFLFSEPVPAYLGTNPQQGNLGLGAKVVNLGDIENKGWDISLNTRNISNDNFNWNSSFIFSTFKNKLTSFGDKNSAIYRNFQFNNTLTKTGVGSPVGQFFGYQVDGIYKSEQDIKDSPTPDNEVGANGKVWIGDIKFKDINGNGKIDTGDRTNIGNPIPKFTYSIINNISYKSLDLSIIFLGTQGNKIYNWTRKLTESLGGTGGPYSNQSVAVNNRFIAGVNENTNIPRYVNGDPNANSRVSDRFVEDGSYLRLQNLTLGYTLPESIIKRTKFFSKLRVYMTGQNLFTITKYSGLDPAVGSFSQDALLSGVDNGRYPVARIYTLGLNLDF